MPNMPIPELFPETETDSVAISGAIPGTGIPDGTI
jgi:hypothetical protein